MLIYVCFLNSVSSCKTVRYHPWDLVPSWNTITMRISHYLIGFSLLLCYHGFKYTEESETKSAANKEHILVQWHQIMLDRIDLIKYPLMEAKIQKLGLLFKKGSQPFQNIPPNLLGNFASSSKRNCRNKNKQLRSHLIFTAGDEKLRKRWRKRQLPEGNDGRCSSGSRAHQPSDWATGTVLEGADARPHCGGWCVGGIQSTISGLPGQEIWFCQTHLWHFTLSSDALRNWKFYCFSWWETSSLYEKTATSDSGISGCWTADYVRMGFQARA